MWSKTTVLYVALVTLAVIGSIASVPLKEINVPTATGEFIIIYFVFIVFVFCQSDNYGSILLITNYKYTNEIISNIYTQNK